MFSNNEKTRVRSLLLMTEVSHQVAEEEDPPPTDFINKVA